MLARVLGITDSHLRAVDVSTIKGYVKAVEKVYIDILDMIKHDNITHIIHAGDMFDTGYDEIDKNISHTNIIREINTRVNGNFDLVLGNHAYLERDRNPEIYLIQPNNYFKPREDIFARKAILNVLPYRRIGNVQFSYFHYQKEDKTYFRNPEEGVKFHIGVYHDECMLPAYIRKAYFIDSKSNAYSLDRYLSNIDMVFLGHIHVKVGVINYKDCSMIIPGAICIRTSKIEERHNSVKLPIWTINDDSTVQLEFADISTHMEDLVFLKDKEPKYVDKFVISKGIKKEETISADIVQANHIISLTSYLQMQGLSPLESKLLNLAIEENLNFNSAMDVYKDWKKEGLKNE